VCNGNTIDSGIDEGEGDLCGRSGRQSAGGRKIEGNMNILNERIDFSALYKF
jgi:hypothetical protein